MGTAHLWSCDTLTAMVAIRNIFTGLHWSGNTGTGAMENCGWLHWSGKTEMVWQQSRTLWLAALVC